MVKKLGLVRNILAAGLVSLGSWLAPAQSGLESKLSLPSPQEAIATITKNISTDYQSLKTEVDNVINANPKETDFVFNFIKGSGVGFAVEDSIWGGTAGSPWDYALTFNGNGFTAPGTHYIEYNTGSITFNGVMFNRGIIDAPCVQIESTTTGDYSFRGGDKDKDDYPDSNFTKGNYSIKFDGAGGANLTVDKYYFAESSSKNPTSIHLENLVGTVDVTRNVFQYSEKGISIGKEVGANPVLNVLNNTFDSFDDVGIEFLVELFNTTGQVVNNSFTNSLAGTGIKGCENFPGTIDTNNFYDLGTDHEGVPINDLNVPPGYVGGENYRLLSTSEMIDAGIDVGLPYKGEAPDIGSHEYIPEPGTLGLLLIGGAVALAKRLRRYSELREETNKKVGI